MKKKKAAGAKPVVHVSRGIKKRMLITVGIIVCGFCVLILNLINISIINHGRYSDLAISQQLRDTVIRAPRGTIYDTNMNVLAESMTAWEVSLSPKDITEENYEKIAAKLSEVLGVKYDLVLEKCGESTYYARIKRQVEQPQVDLIRKWMKDEKVKGISFIVDSKRYYRYNNFCAQVLGFVGVDNQGLSGLEAYYDKTLTGTPGRTVSAKTALGGDMYDEYNAYYEPTPGNSLVLTIDEVIQHYLEKSLENALVEHHVSERVTGIVMNVNTGEILAMATKGDFNPNDPFTIFDAKERERIAAIADPEEQAAALYAAQQYQWRNKAISDAYEPGSTFKIVTASAALESGACTLSSSFYCNGALQVGTHIMHCANRTGHGAENFAQALANSCNPAFIEIGRLIGPEQFYNYFKAFGLTERTGIDLPGEGTSMFYEAKDLGVVELASCSYGQSLSITPLQMITAACAAVNGGYLVQPHVVRQIVDSSNNIIESYDYAAKRQVISAETSKTMAALLENVVETSGRNAYVAGFRIGGKSGTAQKLGKGTGNYVAGFCGFAPADNPEIAMIVLFDEAHSYSIYGGTLVGPVIGTLMSEVLPYLGISPVYTTDELAYADVATPLVEGNYVTQATSQLQQMGLYPEVVGSGTTVVKQFPLQGQSIPKGSKVILYTDPDPQQRVVTMPDITGRSVETVRSILSAMNLNLRVTGSNAYGAVAVHQSAPEGQQLAAGSVVTVEFVQETVDASPDRLSLPVSIPSPPTETDTAQDNIIQTAALNNLRPCFLPTAEMQPRRTGRMT